MSTTVHVKNIGPNTSEQQVKDFFSFCGKINNISLTSTSNDASSSKSATVTFEKEAAAKTALLLDHTKLGESTVEVTAGQSLGQLAGGASTDKSYGDDHLDQEDKPRSRIIAEYLAHGYVIGDKAIERALALDQQHGISARFTSALSAFDQKYKATDTAKGMDAKYGVSDKAGSVFSSLNSYYEKSMDTPTGQRLAAFYKSGSKQVIDVHNEARRLADLKAGKSSGSSAATTEATNTGILPEKADLHPTGDHVA